MSALFKKTCFQLAIIGLLIEAAQAQTLTETNSPPVTLPIPPPAPSAQRTPGSPLTSEIEDFSKNSPAIQQLLTAALELSAKGLVYKMGSAKPENGGMDCSGTIYYLLRSLGVPDVPRQSDEQYRWLWEAGTFVAVNGVEEKTFEYSHLRPGCLLFWTGTYDVGKRNPPISHVMLYLGKRASDGKELMFGASDGRLFDNKPSWGVGVFDFRLPSAKSTTRFIGYGEVPGFGLGGNPDKATEKAGNPSDS